MNLSLIPVSEGLIEYCFQNRLNKDKYDIDEAYFMELWLKYKTYMRIIVVDDAIVGVSGLIPGEDGLLGYLILTNSYKKYAKYIIKQIREVFSKIKCKIKFINHHDDKVTHKWYGLLGFKRIDNYWVREALI